MLTAWLQRLIEIAAPLLAQLAGQKQRTGEQSGETDVDGFTHIRPTEVPPTSQEHWVTELSRFIEGLNQAIGRDLLQSSVMP
jgi:hypothetical protein